MNAEQQKQFKLNWLWSLLKPLLVSVIAELGEGALEWIKRKLDEDKSAEKQDVPWCPTGQEWNPILGKCVDPIGK